MKRPLCLKQVAKSVDIQVAYIKWNSMVDLSYPWVPHLWIQRADCMCVCVGIYTGIYIHMYVCNLEIKRRLLLGRKAMKNLDSILKSRDITLSTKARLVKAMVFPVAICGCESWTVKKAERRRIDAFEL